eukprot:bmy_05082T0
MGFFPTMLQLLQSQIKKCSFKTWAKLEIIQTLGILTSVFCSSVTKALIMQVALKSDDDIEKKLICNRISVATPVFMEHHLSHNNYMMNKDFLRRSSVLINSKHTFLVLKTR